MERKAGNFLSLPLNEFVEWSVVQGESEEAVCYGACLQGSGKALSLDFDIPWRGRQGHVGGCEVKRHGKKKMVPTSVESVDVGTGLKT